MNKKARRVLYIMGIIIAAVILFMVIKGISGRRYTSRLPEYPDLTILSKPLREQISTAGKKAHKNPSAANLGMLGMVYHSAAYYDKAAECYQLAAERSGKDAKWNYYLGYLELELGESKKALENFQQVTAREPENHLAWYYQAEALRNLGSGREAEKIFKKIAILNDQDALQVNTLRKNLFPLQAYAMFRLARIYMDTNKPDSAEASLYQIIQSNITFGPAYRLLGNLYSAKGDSLLSRKFITRANDMAIYTPPPDSLIDRLTLISRSDQYLMKQIDVSVQSLNPDYTIHLLNNALKYFPDNKYLISKAMSLFLLLGDGEQALPYIEKHLYYFKDDYKELMDVADLLYDNGYKEKAMDYFNQAKKSKSGEPDTQSQLAIWLYERGMKTESLQLINDQLARMPENSNVLVDAVYILLLNGDIDRAGQLLSKLAALKPDDALTIKMKAISTEKQGDLKPAINLYEKAFEANPEDMSTIKYLGMIYMREQMWKEALALFRKALEYHPNEPYLLEILGKILVSCPDEKFRSIPEGKDFSERAFYRLTSPPMTQVSAGINLSIAYSELGDRKNASSCIRKTLSLARKANAPKDYLAYIEDLSEKFSLP